MVRMSKKVLGDLADPQHLFDTSLALILLANQLVAKYYYHTLDR